MTDIFEKASRLKLRFETSKGSLLTEDLWSLPLESLNTLAKSANKRVKAADEENFISKRQAADVAAQLELDIVKRVIEVRLKEAEDAKTKAQRREELQYLRELKAKKQTAKLESLSEEELDKRMAELDAAV